MKRTSFLSSALYVGLFCAPTAIAGISGRVIDQNHKPLGGVTVTLVAKAVTATTNADGTFDLLSTGSFPVPPSPDIHAPVNAVLFNLASRANVSVSLFDTRGRLVTQLFSETLDRGAYSMNVPASVLKNASTGMYLVAVRCGGVLAVKKYVTLSRRSGGLDLRRLGDAREERAIVFSAPAAVADTLRASKSGLFPRHVTIASYSNQAIGDLLLYNDVEAKVDSVLKLMSLKDKVAQMTQALITALAPNEVATKGFGSVFNGGGDEPPAGNTKQTWRTWIDGIQQQALSSPLKIPMIYGIDAVHGNAKVCGSTVFPHNIGLGCSRDTALARRIGEVTAKECAGVGVKWTFAPCCAAARNEKWGRTYEGFGETSEINDIMTAAMVRGMQGNLSDDSCILACVKHYAGEGGTKDGANQGDATMSDDVLRKVHLPQYLTSCKLGAGSVMPSYHSLNNEKCSASDYLMNKILKGEMGFDGIILSDWDAIALITIAGESYPPVYQESEIKTAINAGMDMAMTTADTVRNNQWMKRLESLAASNQIPASRIDDAVRRILRIKFRMRLWDRPMSNQNLFDQIGCQAHRDVAREAVRKSLVLLKNGNNALPLKKNQKVVVCGEWADRIGWQCGAWTKNWQGNVLFNNSELGGTSLLAGMKNVGGVNVVYSGDGSTIDADASAVVIFFGEITYAEGLGDYNSVFPTWLPGAWTGYKINLDLTQILAENDRIAHTHFAGLIAKIKQQKPTVPIVCVLISGRPLIIGSQLEQSSAFVAAWYPGTEGQGVAEVLYGDHPFTGKLSHTWPNSVGQIPINTDPQPGEQAGIGGTPLFTYGFGMSY